MKNLTLDIHIPKTEFINLQTDFGFKRIFGSEKRKSILIRFLNALFEGEFIIEDVITRVRDKNFMFFNQAKDIEYWAAFQGRLIYLYSLVLIPEDKLPV